MFLVINHHIRHYTKERGPGTPKLFVVPIYTQTVFATKFGVLMHMLCRSMFLRVSQASIRPYNFWSLLHARAHCIYDEIVHGVHKIH